MFVLKVGNGFIAGDGSVVPLSLAAVYTQAEIDAMLPFPEFWGEVEIESLPHEFLDHVAELLEDEDPSKIWRFMDKARYLV